MQIGVVVTCIVNSLQLLSILAASGEHFSTVLNAID